jgi:hypothetical protein
VVDPKLLSQANENAKEVMEIAKLKNTRDLLPTGTVISLVYILWQVVRYYNNIPGLVELVMGKSAETPQNTIKISEEQSREVVKKMVEEITSDKDSPVAKTFEALVKGIPVSENVDVKKLRDLALFGEVGINQDGLLEIDGKTILVPRIDEETGAVRNVKLQVMDPEDAKNARLILVQKDKEGVYVNEEKRADSR